ncbi:tripartite tricarboxylate transporter TctB family protein [Thermodesulfobacteriota bacterium]
MSSQEHRSLSGAVTPLILPALIMAVCIYYGWLTSELRSRPLPGASTLGPAFVPWILSFSTGLLSLFELISGLRRLSHNRFVAMEAAPHKTKQVVRNASMIGLFIIFIFLMPKFGFLIMSILFLVGAILIIGGWNWPTLIITPPLVGFPLYFIFTKLLYVPLP